MNSHHRNLNFQECLSIMRFIASRGKQSQLGGQNWFDEKSELFLRMEMRFWGRATRGIFLSSSAVDLESLSVLSDLEKKIPLAPRLHFGTSQILIHKYCISFILFPLPYPILEFLYLFVSFFIGFFYCLPIWQLHCVWPM